MIRLRRANRNTGSSGEITSPGATSAKTRSRDDLTPRELQVAQLVAVGDSNKEIAAQLGISVRTVENRLSVIYDKIGFRNRVLLTRWLLAARDGEEMVGVV